MEYLGLIVEFFFLLLGVYLYLFAIGKLTAGGEDTKVKAERFRQQNSWWLRLGALAIIAIMLINIAVHVMDLMD
ncbi:MAG: hypothetical protein R3350_04095 [Saprospiraceae bacterium]|nr:hypothetical protein [Saprospiraceae bacterium]